MVLLSSGGEQYDAMTTNRDRATHTTPAETNGVEHTAETTHSIPVETTEQPKPPQTLDTLQGREAIHAGATANWPQERNYGIGRTPSRNHQKYGSTQGQTNNAHGSKAQPG
ncbi:hypothetical protein Taro_035420 [Colocasia esculenta]|uniref:Uncharacterized protein n=1 Tax=Colocasia esculenta TaxID=4460 RepID=A0A843W5P5_COLES|nr:hypothetical protein [Colocasia esculenta]